jgi:D-lactate dehydrogenase
MRVAFFSSKHYDQASFSARVTSHELVFHEPRLTVDTLPLARGFEAICVFVNDVVDRTVLADLTRHGLKLVALRCAGFNNVDLQAAKEFGIDIVRVPAYSPHAVAEHTFGLILTLNRHLHKAYARVREGDFRLDGMLGFDLHGRTIGVIGTGKIGECVCHIAKGFGCRVLAHDVAPSAGCESMGIEYVDTPRLLGESDIVTLHCPLVPQTRYLINDYSIEQMKPDVMLINTSRGAIVDTQAVIRGLKSGQIGSLGIDVYEEEADLFFEDLQGFFTADALRQIATITLQNISDFERNTSCDNKVVVNAPATT